MPFKKNGPGCPCCGCVPTTWDATPEEDWTNDGNWTADGTEWVTTTQDSLLLLNNVFDSASHAIRWRWEVTAADGVWRCIFWREDADNYWVLQIAVDYAPAGSDPYTILSWIQVSGGFKTVIREAGGTQDVTGQTSLRVTVCWSDDKLSAKVETYNGSSWSTVYVFGRSGVTAPAADTTVGFRAVSFDQDETRLVSIEDTCETCSVPCPCSDGYGPAQYQVVVSGYTGGCAVWNGTYILDANWLKDGTYAFCRWDATYGNDPGDPYAKEIYLIVYGNQVILQLHHSATTVVYWTVSGTVDCTSTIIDGAAVSGGVPLVPCGQVSSGGVATVTPV